MKRRALWIGGATLALSASACGPMPGYVAPDGPADSPRERNRGVTYAEPGEKSEVEEAPPVTPEVDRRLRVRAGDRDYAPPAAREPAPAAPQPEVSVEVERVPMESSAPAAAPVAPAAGPSKLQVVPLDRADSYYLIDRERGLCFFIHKESSAKFDCALIPEARDVVAPALPADPGPAPAPAAKPAPAAPADAGAAVVRRRYVEPAPADKASPPPAARPEAPAPPEAEGAPSADELSRFEDAYVEIACDRRKGSFTPPRDRISAAGLTPQRYSDIEEWLTSDERSWRLLANRAYRECDARK